MDIYAFLSHLAGRLENGPNLHSSQGGQVNAQAYAAQAEHRIGFVHPFHGIKLFLFLGQFSRSRARPLQRVYFQSQIELRW